MRPTLNALRRANRAARIRSGQRGETLIDRREGVADDLTTVTLHPTKGFRRINGKRLVVAPFVQRYGRAA